MATNTNQNDTVEQVGVAYVDAGILWVGDPCYIVGEDASHGVKTWNDFCDLTFDDANERADGVTEPLGTGIGLAVNTGYGDGSYPVTVTRNSEGRIASVTVTFIDDEADEDR